MSYLRQLRQHLDLTQAQAASVLGVTEAVVQQAEAGGDGAGELARALRAHAVRDWLADNGMAYRDAAAEAAIAHQTVGHAARDGLLGASSYRLYRHAGIPLPDTPGARLRYWRWDRYLSQGDVARVLGVTRGAVSQAETGHTDSAPRFLRELKARRGLTRWRELGARLRRWREERGWSQTRLGEEIGVSVGSVCRAEHAQTAKCETLIALCHVAGIELPPPDTPGEALRRWRWRHGLELADAARLLGTTKATLSRNERGLNQRAEHYLARAREL